MVATANLLSLNEGLTGEIVVAGRPVPLALRRSKRARRMLLKLDLRTGGIELVLPNRASAAQGLRFVEQQQAWIARRMASLPPRIRFEDGAEVPVLGSPCRIRHQPGRRGSVWLENAEIHVAGGAEHINRRVTDWFKDQARKQLGQRARAAAARLGKPVGRVTVRDTDSRWGSCSAAGTLSFSWRLLLAPEWVLDYVVAHEVAHLAEMNHGRRFWALVGMLHADIEAPRAWLRANGAALHRYG